MTHLTKPQTAWAVIDRLGNIHLNTVGRTRAEAVAHFCVGMRTPWEWWEHKGGVRAVRVQITPLDP